MLESETWDNVAVNKILVVDDHDLVRRGICALLQQVSGVQVVGQAASGEAALELAKDLHPDIVMMDIRMPGIGGLEATRRILSTHPNIKVIVVSAFNDDLYPSKLLKAGASGYITKNADAREISAAVEAVINDRVYVSPAIAQQLVVNGLNSGNADSPFASLSQRELQIAQMICSGQRANEVAGILNVSPKTINTYKYRIYEKLSVNNDVELTLAAVKYGLVDPGELI